MQKEKKSQDTECSKSEDSNSNLGECWTRFWNTIFANSSKCELKQRWISVVEEASNCWQELLWVVLVGSPNSQLGETMERIPDSSTYIWDIPILVSFYTLTSLYWLVFNTLTSLYWLVSTLRLKHSSCYNCVTYHKLTYIWLQGSYWFSPSF